MREVVLWKLAIYHDKRAFEGEHIKTAVGYRLSGAVTARSLNKMINF